MIDAFASYQVVIMTMVIIATLAVMTVGIALNFSSLTAGGIIVLGLAIFALSSAESPAQLRFVKNADGLLLDRDTGCLYLGWILRQPVLRGDGTPDCDVSRIAPRK